MAERNLQVVGIINGGGTFGRKWTRNQIWVPTVYLVEEHCLLPIQSKMFRQPTQVPKKLPKVKGNQILHCTWKLKLEKP